ncbi:MULTISPECIES: D-TA family PLP-dependent enzyme [Sutcliffiella]|nr:MULTISPECIES: D-TA family PLP-dependent enzyme [Sutcliffiella]WBL15570.1 D-TA family PLP-dependent enzyme [Sutcliffiella sp. NC1]
MMASNIQELDTPTLLVDYKKLTKNIGEMSSFAREQGIALRPHIKTHKSIHIAKMQVEHGAVGITVAKVDEALVMASGGIKDILIAYPIASPQKIKRIVQLLQENINVKLAVDSVEQLKYLQKELEETPFTLEVWIKVNSGLNRCGVEPGKDAVKLAQAILFLSKLKLGGIFTHAGHSYGATSYYKIEQIGAQEANAVIESANACEAAGIPISVRSVGSTPTYRIAGKVKGITEIRPGNAAFFDSIQVGLGVAKEEDCALTVLASVVSKYGEERIVFDTGSKALNLDKGAHGNSTVNGFGTVVGHEEITIERLSEEHGVGTINGHTNLQMNDKVQIIPNHACTVANLFDEYVVHDDGKVINRWKVDARGMNK